MSTIPCPACGAVSMTTFFSVRLCKGRADQPRRRCKALASIPNPIPELVRLRDIEWAARRYLVLEACDHTDADMYAAWDELKAYLGLSDITPEEATEELRKMEQYDAS